MVQPGICPFKLELQLLYDGVLLGKLFVVFLLGSPFFDSLRFLTEAVSVAICRLQKSSWSLSRRFSLVSLSHLRRGSSGLLVIDSGCLSQIIADGVTDFSEGSDDLFQSGNFRLEGNDFPVFFGDCFLKPCDLGILFVSG